MGILWCCMLMGILNWSLHCDALGQRLLLKPFGEWSVKVLWLCQWDNSSATCYSHESGSSQEGTAGELRRLSLIFFIIIGLFSLMLFDFMATAATTSMRFLFRFLFILFIRWLLFRLLFWVGTFLLYCRQLAHSLFDRLPCLEPGMFHKDSILNVIKHEFRLFLCLEHSLCDSIILLGYCI